MKSVHTLAAITLLALVLGACSKCDVGGWFKSCVPSAVPKAWTSAS